MNETFKKMLLKIFFFFIIAVASITLNKPIIASASSTDSTDFIKKVSNSYTKKFCNAIAFGLSKESAMNFSFDENNKAFEKKKQMKNINKELLAEEIAISVIEKCGYPINLSGEEGIKDFTNYYLSKDKATIKKVN